MIDWKTIETAPKDGTVILLSNGKSIGHGWWDDPSPEYSGWVSHIISRWPDGGLSNPSKWALIPDA